MKIYFLLPSLILLFVLNGFSQTPISGVVNGYYKVTMADSAKGYLRAPGIPDMSSYTGKSVMIVQMKGATINEVNSVAFGDITSFKQAGLFEFGIMCGQQSDTIILENKFQNLYDVNGAVQIVFLPKYFKANIIDSLKAKPWDPVSGTGGIVAIEATDTVFLNAPVYADGAGFRGGVVTDYPTSNCGTTNFPPFTETCTEYYLSGNTGNVFKNAGKKGEGIAEYIASKEFARGKQANGGGGGNNSNHGGGGGANYGAGGIGGYTSSGGCTNSTNRFPGQGGKELQLNGYSLSQFRIFMGGGGGAGHENNNVGTPGGNGGGIVYIKCKVLKSAGKTISANGTKPYQPGLYSGGTVAGGDGGGGGGAGGVVILNTLNVNGSLTIEANGANGSGTGGDGGGCTGPGGGGGGGVAWFATPLIPSGVFVNTLAGYGGTANGAGCNGAANGSASGGNGTSVYNFTLPLLKDSSLVCKSILPQSILVSFKGYEAINSRRFIALLNDISASESLMLQRSFDAIHFETVVSQPNNFTDRYNFSDGIQPSTVFYRLKIRKINGHEIYSDVIKFSSTGITKPTLNIFPNPAQQRLQFKIKVRERQIVNASIIDQSGVKITTVRIILTPLSDQYALPLTGIASGVYQLVITGDNLKLSKRFTKL